MFEVNLPGFLGNNGCRIPFLLFMLSFFATVGIANAHTVTENEELVLDFSHDSIRSDISTKFIRLNQSKQLANITQIKDAFVFDPILLNFQVYNDTRDRLNRTYFDGSGIDIELITTYVIKSNESDYQVVTVVRPVPQYFVDRVDFTTHVDPSVDLEIFDLFDNQTTVEYLRGDPLGNVDVSFKLEINRLGFLLPEFDIRIDYHVRVEAGVVIPVEQFH